MPNGWSATLGNVSLTDGAHHRFLVGTLLRPVTVLTGSRYWPFAVFALLVLAGLLATALVLSFRTPLVSQRLLLIGWLLLPTGAYLFNEVGYLDQVLYLLLFASVWALRRNRFGLAVGLMVAAACTHEIALLTVLPLFGFAAVLVLPLRRAVAAVAIPAAANCLLLLVPGASSDGLLGLQHDLQRHGDFAPRIDALALFTRSRADTWVLYSPGRVFHYLYPIAIVLAVAAIVLLWPARRAADTPAPVGRFLVFAIGVAAALSPLLLVFAGWDQFRWAFLLVTNLFLVVWLFLDHTGRELDLLRVGALAITVLVLTHWQLHHLDGVGPRGLDRDSISAFAHEVRSGELFDIPRDGVPSAAIAKGLQRYIEEHR
jgi:hypothetical protein